MKRKLVSLMLVVVFLLSLSTYAVFSLPPTCPDCGAYGTYHNVYVTYNYGFVRFAPCILGEGHLDSVYYLWRYTYNTCDECGFCSPRTYFEGYWSLCPGEPIPDLIVYEP